MASATNDRTITWRSMRWVVALVALLAAVGLYAGGNYAHSYVSSQLAQESITMPGGDGLKGLPKDSQDALAPYADQQMTTGPQAEAYANNYIYQHMKEACNNVKTADGTAVTAVPADKCTYAGIGAVARGEKNPDALAAYNALRASNFQGDALRSMLLTAYAFWTVGTIALVASWVALAAALLFTTWNLVTRRRKA